LSLGLGLVAWLAMSGAPASAVASAPRENPSWGPLQVCGEMVKAAREQRYDDLLAHTSNYARAHIGMFQRILLKLACGRIAKATCVEAHAIDADHALVKVASPNGSVMSMPFVHEEQVWRFDQQRWEELKKHSGPQ
jgi:hypothetical protein